MHAHLPLFFILMTLHVECLGVNKISTNDDGARLHVWQDLVGKQAAWAAAFKLSHHQACSAGRAAYRLTHCRSPSLSPYCGSQCWVNTDRCRSDSCIAQATSCAEHVGSTAYQRLLWNLTRETSMLGRQSKSKRRMTPHAAEAEHVRSCISSVSVR